MRVLSSALLLAVLAAGCAEPEPTPTSPPDGPPVSADTAAEAPPEVSGSFSLPATVTDTLYVEGEPEPVTLRLVQPQGAALPFATYIPEDLDYEASASGEGDSHRFTLGDPSSEYSATLFLFVPSEESGLADPQAYAQALAGDGVALQALDDAPSWVENGYSWFADGRFGTVRAGTRSGRRFYMVETMQEEMGDGFAPRAGTVLSHWLWLPDGAYLEEHF